jgi:Chalcone isomerase-like
MALASSLTAMTFSGHAQTVNPATAKYEPAVEVAGKKLILNGAGIRYKAVFKVYSVGLYLPSKATSAKAVYAMPGTKRVHMVMLREIGGAELGKNFTHHFEDNASREEVTTSINQLIRFGQLFANRKALKEGESVTLDWQPGSGTTISINGVAQGEPFPGENFFNGMLKLWIGDQDSAGVRGVLLGQEPAQTSTNTSKY